MLQDNAWPSMPLRKLIQGASLSIQGDFPELSITGIAFDSRDVQPGNLFVALIGDNADGHRFIPDAIASGAVAVVGVHQMGKVGIPYLQVADSRRALAHLAAAFYDYPGRKLTVIGVTGTDGKTTTINLIYQVLKAAGEKVGMVTTVNAVIGEEIVETGFHVTTPPAPDIQRFLARMVKAGLTHVVLEATSHGLAQARLEGCAFDIGVVTNITHEHLDYHGSYEAYRDAKAALFRSLVDAPEKPFNPPRAGVLNRADESYEYLLIQTKVGNVTYGLHPEAHVRAEKVETSPTGQRFQVVAPDYRFPVSTSLIGEYNVANCLAAIATTVQVLEVPYSAAQEGIANLQGVPGRMERLDLGQAFLAYVDFAHTPNALRRALETARRLTSGRVIAVFGSAGLRDREKRRLMAEISITLADLTVLTAEDPRTEDLAEILAEMAQGAVGVGGVEGRNFWRIPDRGDAIRFAVQKAQPGDLVIACGKGHEQSMCFGEVEYPWDDRIALKAALSEYLGVSGPTMPYLPTQE